MIFSVLLLLLIVQQCFSLTKKISKNFKITQRGPGMIIYNNDQYDPIDHYKNEKRNECENDDYKIYVFMSGDTFSGTNDEVKVRLYSSDNKVTNWLKLDTPGHDDFETLSSGVYCMDPSYHQYFHPVKIGILKKATSFIQDKMKIHALEIEAGRETFYAEEISEWITNEKEYIFNVSS